jgi:hypothetical protein
MEVHAMDEATRESEIRLRKSLSRQDRLLLAGFAAAVLLFGVLGLANWSDSVIAAPIALILGILMLCQTGFGADVLWTIRQDGVLIEEATPLGRRRTRFIRRETISAAEVGHDKANSTRFQLSILLASGDRLTSPPIAEVTRIAEISRRITELLGTADGNPPANPLDATNMEMQIGEPIRKAIGTDQRIITLIIAGLCTIPYAYKFWNGLPLATAEIIFVPVGTVVAFLAFRYAHTSAGTFWIVRHGELRVERLTRDGKPFMDTITGGDVDSIAVERDSKTEEERYVVRIDLLSRQKFLSPGIGTLDETRAVATEIASRLGVASERLRR